MAFLIYSISICSLYVFQNISTKALHLILPLIYAVFLISSLLSTTPLYKPSHIHILFHRYFVYPHSNFKINNSLHKLFSVIFIKTGDFVSQFFQIPLLVSLTFFFFPYSRRMHLFSSFSTLPKSPIFLILILSYILST